MSAGKLRIVFEANDHAGMIAFMTGFLTEEGYDVKRRELHAKETPTQFCERMGLHPSSLSRTLRLPDCPQDFESRRGADGRRVIWLRASPALEDFIKDNKCRAGRGERNGQHA